ncbi:MAG: SCO family protein [Nitrospinae bacterium]|nr:SCO family protein [Nitrospinota bacterium]
MERARFIKIAVTVLALSLTALAAKRALVAWRQGGAEQSPHSSHAIPAPLAPGQQVGAASMLALDRIGHKIEGDYVFTDQSGQPFHLNDWFDKPLIVSYIFTSCENICPTISASLARYIKDGPLKLGQDFRVVSVGFDTEKDTPQALDRFGGSVTASFEHWRFVSGGPETVRALAKELGISYKRDEKGEWMHLVAVTALAPQGVVFRHLFGDTYSPQTINETLTKAARGEPPPRAPGGLMIGGRSGKEDDD